MPDIVIRPGQTGEPHDLLPVLAEIIKDNTREKTPTSMSGGGGGGSGGGSGYPGAPDPTSNPDSSLEHWELGTAASGLTIAQLIAAGWNDVNCHDARYGEGLDLGNGAVQNYGAALIGVYVTPLTGKLSAADVTVQKALETIDGFDFFANPMNAVGDIIVGGLNGLPTRYGVGAAGSFLGVAAGVPAWEDPEARFYTEAELDGGQLDNLYYTEVELGSCLNGLGASLIGVEDALGNYAGVTVEAVLAEIAVDIAAVTVDRLISTNSTFILSDDGVDQTLTGNLGDLNLVANTELWLKAAQDIKLETTSNDFDTTITSNTAATSNLDSVLHLCRKTSGNMVANFGGILDFLVTDSGVTESSLGRIEWWREDADNTGLLCLLSMSAGGPGVGIVISGQHAGVSIGGVPGMFTPAEMLHVFGKSRADSCFNVNGTDGITQFGITAIVIRDVLMNTHTLSFLGGILVGYVLTPP